MEGPKEVLKKVLVTGAIALWLLCGPLIGSAMAQTADANPVNSGDTAWMLISSALVLLMTPGLAFFYGGLVRSRNVLNTMMMSLILMALVGVTWTLWGYSLAFDVDKANLNASGFAQGLEQFI
jgi:Amt family ammonium transporter